MPGDPLSRPLIDFARELRDRRATARDLVDAAIARHESVGERLHAYSFWAPEQARAVADAADAAFAAGVSAGPLQGLPVSLKDLRDIGCVDRSNLITSKSITPDQLAKILSKGQGSRE